MSNNKHNLFKQTLLKCHRYHEYKLRNYSIQQIIQMHLEKVTRLIHDIDCLNNHLHHNELQTLRDGLGGVVAPDGVINMGGTCRPSMATQYKHELKIRIQTLSKELGQLKHCPKPGRPTY